MEPEMDKPLFLGMDIGTSAMKTAVIDQAGNTISTSETPVNNILLPENMVEIDAIEYRNAMFHGIRSASAGIENRIASITISGAAGSALTMDENNTPSNIISWLDRRSAGKLPKCLAGLTSQEVRSITGWPCLESFPLAQLAWLRENAPQRLDTASWAGLCTDYLQFCLCGRHCLDFSTGTTLHLIDQAKRCYHQDFLHRLGLRSEQLSPLLDSGTLVGHLTPEAAKVCGLPEGTAITAGAFDHPSAARGCGVHEEGELLMSCGTSWVAFFPMASREWILAQPHLLCDPFESRKGGCFGAMFSIESLGRKIDNYVRNLIAPGEIQPFDVFNDMAAEAGDIPDFVDLSQPVPEQCPMPPKLLSRAVMNGAAKMFSEVLHKLNTTWHFTKAVLAGGPAKSPVWPDIIRQYSGVDIRVTDSFSGAKGAASLGLFAAKNTTSVP